MKVIKQQFLSAQRSHSAAKAVLTGLFCLLIAACDSNGEDHEQKQDQPKPIAFNYENKSISVSGIKLHYITSNKTDSPNVLVFLHGFPHIAEVWYPLIDHFDNSNHVIATDLVGYGRSDKPKEPGSYRVEKLVADMRLFIDHISPDQPVNIVAHDWGGVLAWGLAQQYPEKIDKLVVINAPQYNAFLKALSNSEKQREASKYIHKLDDWWLRALFWLKGPELLWKGLEPSYREGKIAMAYKDLFFEQWKNTESANAAVAYYTENFPPFDEISEQHYWPSADKKVHVKSLLIWSTKDKAFTLDTLQITKEHATNLDVRLIETDSHTPFLSHTETVINVIEGFLKD